MIIAGKLKLFDLFTRTKERALECKDAEMPKMVDDCINAWTEMTIADGAREAKQVQSERGSEGGRDQGEAEQSCVR